MAINPQKFLPSSKGGALAKVNKTIVSSSTPIFISEKSQKNISIIRVKVIEIDSILKGTIASQKKNLDERKRQDSRKRREDIETKLETKPKAETGTVKVPVKPRMGFLDFVKNFIGNVLLGYFAVRLIDHLPKILPFIKLIGRATDFVLNVGGKLLDGLVTFIDWGYKAYDATRGFAKNLFGEDGVKQFDQLSGLLNKFLNLALIAGMVAAGSGGSGGRGGGKPGARPKPRVTTSGGGSAGRPGVRNPLRQKPTVTTGSGGKPQLRLPGAGAKVTTSGGRRALLSSVRPFLKRIPLPVVGALIDFGLSVALGENPGRAAFRAIGAGLLGAVGAAAGTVVPVAGNFIGGLLGGVAGDAIGGVLYDAFFGAKSPSASKGRTTKKAGGGVTRGGKQQGGVKRTFRKGKYKRKLSPRKPSDVDFEPGADVGGENKIFGLFPKPPSPDFANPFGIIEDAGKELGKSDYFGPILAITSKIILGQKPNSKDYENVGLGINLLVAKGINEGKLKGGLAAAFAEGGLVDPKSLSAISEGGDISQWVAASFKDATETNAQKTLREIQENLKLKKGTAGPDKSDPTEQVDEDIDIEGGSGGQWGPLLDLIAGKESGGNYEAMYPSTTLKGATKMTIADVARRATGAVGKYQQLPQYLVSRAKAAGLNPDKDLYSPENQDLIITKGNIEGNRGGRRWLKGEMSDEQFMQGLSQEFASLPNARGQFYYPGQRSSMTPDKIKTALSKVKKGGYAVGRKDMDIAGKGQGGVVGGSGNFIQGNSGASYGVHFHIGPGNQTKGTVLQPQYNADARASALKAFMQLVGQRSIYLVRSGVSVPKGKKISSAEASKLISNEQRAHSSKGSQGGIDMQVDFESKVAFPLKTFGMQYRPNGFGVSADIAGSNSFVAHGRYDEKGKVAPQEGMGIYGDGGMTPDYPHLAILGDKNEEEIVVDGDSAKLVPDLVLAINQAKNMKGIVKAIQNYAPYDSMSPQTVFVPMPEIDDYEDSSYPTGDSDFVLSGSAEEELDVFSTLEMIG